MTQNLWFSLFLTCGDTAPDPTTLTQQFTDLLNAQGYTAYNPFGIVPGRVYNRTVRAFIAPVRGNWVQILAESPLPRDVIEGITAGYTGLMVRVDAPDVLTIEVYHNGQPAADAVAALVANLRDGKTEHDLASTLTRSQITIIEPESPDEFLPPDALPDDIKQMAQGVDADNLNKMLGKVTDGLFGRLNADSEAAKALVQQSAQMNWNTPNGWKIRALLEMLNVPPGWREPPFVSLRSAYSLHARRQRKPDARLYPGDEETMKLVPNALDYTPVYAGKDA